MTTWLRRLFWLGLLTGAACAVATALKRRNEPAPAAARPADVRAAPTSFTEVTDDAAGGVRAQPDTDRQATAASRWADPVDGACPAGYTIKANAKSEIYHVPGGRFYDRTIPERCYATAEDAEADGYRRSKA